MMTAERPALGIPVVLHRVSGWNSGARGIQLTVEGASESVNGDNYAEGGDPSGEGRANSSLGLDGSAREGSCGRIATEEGSEDVSDADGDL